MNKVMKQGFTLIELMVVVIIVGILAAVAVPKMAANRTKAQATEGIAACGSLKTAIEMYILEKGSFPTDVAALTGADLISSADLDGTYYKNGSYSWTTTDDTTFEITVAEGLQDSPKIVYTVTAGAISTALTDHS